MSELPRAAGCLQMLHSVMLNRGTEARITFELAACLLSAAGLLSK